MAPKHNFQIKTFDQLTLHELHAIYVTRAQVFTVGQQITEQDPDRVDLHSMHLFNSDPSGQVLAYCRLFDLGKYADTSHTISPGAWTIGRVAVLAGARGSSLGQALLERAIAWIKDHTQAERIELTAQSYLIDTLYKEFTVQGTEFLEAGIPHYHLELQVQRGQ